MASQHPLVPSDMWCLWTGFPIRAMASSPKLYWESLAYWRPNRVWSPVVGVDISGEWLCFVGSGRWDLPCRRMWPAIVENELIERSSLRSFLFGKKWCDMLRLTSVGHDRTTTETTRCHGTRI
jgi:hypothetical protein